MLEDSNRCPGDSPDEVSAALELIAEYTEKVTKRCGLHDIHATREMMSGTFILLLGVMGGIFFHTLLAPVEEIGSLLGIAAVAAFSSSLMIFAWMRKRSRLRFEISIAASGLEKLVRRASSIYENATLGPGDRLKMDVRLGEAEAALGQAARYGWRPDAWPQRLERNEVSPRSPEGDRRSW